MQPTPTHQFSLDLIEHKVESSIVQQRKGDGYINATALCNAAGKRWYNYLRTETTGHFLRALAAKTQIRVMDLVQEVRIGSETGAPSTWVHPQVALHLAQWLSPEFAVQVTEWVQQWLSGGRATSGAQRMPPHIARHMLNVGRVPMTHFSILQELTLTLVAPLEAQGYTLPERLVPDISQGKMFCKFAREQLGLDTEALPTYTHQYPDGRQVQAKLYPVEHLSAFRTFINNEWLPKRAAAYFRERDVAALPYLDAVLRITYNPAKMAAQSLTKA